MRPTWPAVAPGNGNDRADKALTVKRRSGPGIYFVLGLALWSIPGQVGTAYAEKIPLNVFVSIPPQKYFVERIGGELVDVSVMVAPGQSPETYSPTPQQMARLSKADIYFGIGIPFERRLLEKLVSLTDSLPIIDTRRGIPLRPMEGHDDGEEKDSGNTHGESDPHIWLDPQLVKIQARTMADELSRLLPDRRDQFLKNYERLAADLDEIDSLIAARLAIVRGRTLMVFHPAFGYFTDRYGLIQEPIQSAGKEPGAARLADLVTKAHRKGIRAIVVQKQFASKTAEAVAREIGAEIVILDPLAYDYLNNLRAMTEEIRVILSEQEKPADE